MGHSDLTLESVFVTDAFPQHTYVAAEEGKIEKALNDGLAIQNKIVSIVGPSKCGKTTLCDRVFGTERGVEKLMVTGDSFDTTEDFWKLLFQQTEAAEGYNDDEMPNRNVVIDAIAAQQLPVVIDDFHYIEQNLQRVLCRQLKNAAAMGVRFVVLNTPQRSDDPIRSNQDLAGRFYSVNVDFWGKGGLREIGKKGFQALGVKVDDRVLDILATECLGSPQLMQTLCLESGREYLTQDRPYKGQEISANSFSWAKVRERAVMSYDHTALFQKLKNGPPRRGQARNDYNLKDGSKGDVYDVITYALATDPPFSSLHIDDLRERGSKMVLTRGEPNYSAALDQLNGLFDRGHKPVEYDEEKRTINILDPHFYFYLRTKATLA